VRLTTTSHRTEKKGSMCMCSEAAKNDDRRTKKPKLKPDTTMAAMEKAASSRSPMWPMKACETALIPYSAFRCKMAGPTICHSFFDSTHHSNNNAQLARRPFAPAVPSSAASPARGCSSGALADSSMAPALTYQSC
jgi:hypothetical protein